MWVMAFAPSHAVYVWVNVGHGFLTTHNDTQKLNAKNLWVVWVAVSGTFKRAPNGVLTPNLHTHNFFE
jgi:hypothetical protein